MLQGFFLHLLPAPHSSFSVCVLLPLLLSAAALPLLLLLELLGQQIPRPHFKRALRPLEML